MFSDQVLRALATHDSHCCGIYLENLVFIMKNDALAGTFEQCAKLLFRFTQRLLRALALGLVNDAGANQVLPLCWQAKQSHFSWNEAAVRLPVRPLKNQPAPRERFVHFLSRRFTRAPAIRLKLGTYIRGR